jgi:DNA-binding response OmpR family regulator
MVTALDKDSDREFARLAGADDFLTKPVEDDVLFPTIRRLLEQINAEPASSASAL